MSDPTAPRGRSALAVAMLVVVVGALAVTGVVLHRVAGPESAPGVPAAISGTPASSPAPTPVPATSPAATPASTLAFADCTTAHFGAALPALGGPADPHVYTAAPAWTIDTGKLYLLTITTAKGMIGICLQPDLAPRTVNVIVTLARNHFYNGLTFHRVEPGFVIQGGDPKGDGSGGPGFSFPDEPVVQQYVEGAVAMANSGKNTNGSQFFICTGDDTTKLQPLYNLFGKVSSGLDVALAVTKGDVMTSVTVAQQA